MFGFSHLAKIPSQLLVVSAGNFSSDNEVNSSWVSVSDVSSNIEVDYG